MFSQAIDEEGYLGGGSEDGRLFYQSACKDHDRLVVINDPLLHIHPGKSGIVLPPIQYLFANELPEFSTVYSGWLEKGPKTRQENG